MKHAKGIEKWGRDTAKERYGSAQGPLEGTTAHQPPQDPIDKHGKTYDNDVKGWAYDGGESRPTFDKGREGKV